jgi:hypothetical protein
MMRLQIATPTPIQIIANTFLTVVEDLIVDGSL